MTILLALLIFISPIIFFCIEKNNLKAIESDLIGIYVSDHDTIVLNEHGYSYKKKRNSENGIWDLITSENISIRLTDTKNRFIEYKISYENERPNLINEDITYNKLTH